MRTMIYELRPETLSQVGLVQALTGQVTALRSRHGIDVQADLAEIEALQISEELKEALYLIAREALHNVVKHAHASLVKLSLRCQNASPDNVTLEVCDNGRGFKADGIFPGHLGLQSIRERVAQFEGALEIESSPGTGTNLRVHFPLKPFDH
jgi:signal transduction histidine kinase